MSLNTTGGTQHGYSNSSPVSYVSESVSPIQPGSHDFVNGGSSYSSYYGNQHYSAGFNGAVQQHSPSGSAAQQQESLMSA